MSQDTTNLCRCINISSIFFPRINKCTFLKHSDSICWSVCVYWIETILTYVDQFGAQNPLNVFFSIVIFLYTRLWSKQFVPSTILWYKFKLKVLYICITSEMKMTLDVFFLFIFAKDVWIWAQNLHTDHKLFYIITNLTCSFCCSFIKFYCSVFCSIILHVFFSLFNWHCYNSWYLLANFIRSAMSTSWVLWQYVLAIGHSKIWYLKKPDLL